MEFPPFDNRLVVKGTGDCLNLREWPVRESKILTCLPDGSILEPLITDGPPGEQWGRVRTEQGLEGWVCVSCGYLDWIK